MTRINAMQSWKFAQTQTPDYQSIYILIFLI
jgi:hypothetical protein